MSKLLWDELRGEVERRKDNVIIQHQEMMADLYEGRLPPQYDKYFPSNAPKHIVQLVKDAWNAMTSDVGVWPDLRTETLDETQREERFVGKHERIGHSYIKHAEPTGRGYLKQLAWWLTGTGRAVTIVRPDHENKRPVLTVRDPRTAFPHMRMVGNQPTELYDIVFEYEIAEATAIKMGLAPDRQNEPAGAWTGDARKTKVIEFIDDQQWVVVSEHGMTNREVHGLGKCPAWVFQTFAPNSKGGISMFKDQVSLMVAVSMLISLKLAAADKNVNPIYWAKGHMGTVKIGPNQLNKLSPSGEIGRIEPPQLLQTDRDIAQLTQFSNILNKNPEVRQGQVDSKGAYQSAKTLEELSSAIDPTIDDFTDDMSNGLQWILGCAYAMDEMLWPNEEKRISLSRQGTRTSETYTPADDIKGRWQTEVEYGFGGGGYQGFLMHVQANQAKLLSRKTAQERMPGVSDVAKEQRQMQIEDLDDAGMALIQSQAASGELDLGMWARMRKEIATGSSLHEVVEDIQEDAERQAAAVAQTEGGVAPITAAPVEETVNEEAAPPPGLNPAALV